MNEKLIRARFDGLSDLERTELMNSLAEKFMLKFKKPGNFSRWGNGVTTGIFERDGAEFVFVPGDTVTLGWESFSEGLTEYSEEELRETFDAFEFDDTYEDFIGSDMTPVRTVEIPPMLVERKPRELCGDKLSVDDPRILPEWREALTKAICGRELPTALTLIDRVRFTRRGDVWQAELLGGVTYAGLLENLANEGYSLPTADEWAYLCGGGCRTLFPWGDGMHPDMRFRHFDKAPYTLEKQNFFGIKIAYDPYKSELIMADPPLSCGGDGGGNICGGLGLLLGYLPCSPHHKPRIVMEPIDGEWYNYRRIIRIV